MSAYEAQPPGRRIGLKAPITGLVLILLVAFGSYWGWQRAFGEPTAVDVVADECATPGTTAVTSAPPPTSGATTATTAAAGATATVVAAGQHPNADVPAAGTIPARYAVAATTPAVPSTTTSPPPGTGVLDPADVGVNVYNATARPGLAANTAAVLRDRGFTVLEVNNAPSDDLVAGVAEVRAAAADGPEVLLLVQHVPGAVVVPDGRLDASIDLVLGDEFTSLGDPALVTPVPLPSRSC